jgi:hypothetical protein
MYWLQQLENAGADKPEHKLHEKYKTGLKKYDEEVRKHDSYVQQAKDKGLFDEPKVEFDQPVEMQKLFKS